MSNKTTASASDTICPFHTSLREVHSVLSLPLPVLIPLGSSFRLRAAYSSTCLVLSSLCISVKSWTSLCAVTTEPEKE